MTDADSELRRQAERRADMKLAFRSHLTAYMIVNAGLFAIDWVTSPGIDWAFWPAIGWGIGLAAHAAATFGYLGDSRERLVEKELERLKARR
ncbi:2TM domain-containing protein [Phenylobacterium sp. J367]|uniref:2TM domain-containing protein n=1 Tax=Phenylobacterium sp. J367 TaxID=2898435 RepID=UPI0021512163|nr:2TM domain-containing protein [Phenylobacterium sp. J367]MCR5880563.1 2TM domain-containing protein [Phenylobacterium sp. J367]